MTCQPKSLPDEAVPMLDIQLHRIDAEGDKSVTVFTAHTESSAISPAENAGQVLSDQPAMHQSSPLPTTKTSNRARRRCGQITADYWTYELVGVFLCISTLVSIAAVLFAFDRTPTPHVMARVTVSVRDIILAPILLIDWPLA